MFHRVEEREVQTFVAEEEKERSRNDLRFLGGMIRSFFGGRMKEA